MLAVIPSQTIVPLKRTTLAPCWTSRTPVKVALLVASVNEPLAWLTWRSPTRPLALNDSEVCWALPSILSWPWRSTFLPPAMLPTRWAEMSALADTMAPARSKATSTVPLAVLGPTLIVPAIEADTPVVSDAFTFNEAPVTETSPTLTLDALAVSSSDATP